MDKTKHTHGWGDAPVRLSDVTPDNLGFWGEAWYSSEQYRWGHVYSQVRDINIFLENIDGSEAVGASLKETLKGEAYFLRAYYYHNLLRLFGSVPIIDEAFELGGDLSQYQVPRGSFAETVDFIAADLDRAAERLTVEGRAKGTATKGAALALKSRVLLHAASDLFAENPSGITQPSRLTLTFGLFLFDPDLDGDLDLFAANGHIRSSVDELTPRERADRSRARKVLAQARQHFSGGRYGRALELTEQAEDIDPRSAEVLFARGEILRQMDQVERAEAVYRRALRQEGSAQHPVRLRLGDIAREEKQYQAALDWYQQEWEALNQRLEREGQSYEDVRPRTRDGQLLQTLQVRRARTHALMSELREAEELLDEVLRRDPTHALAHYYLAKIDQERGRVQKALDRAQRAVRLEPAHPVYRYLLGSLLVQVGRPQEALSHLQMVVRSQPHHVGAYYNLGQAHLLTGQKEQGLRYLAHSDSLRIHQQRIN